MLKIKILFVFVIAALSFSSCSVAKRLSPISDALQAAAFSDKTAMDKLDVLGNSLNTVLNESITFSSSKKTVQFINQFSKQNDKAITKILADLDGEVKGMNLIQRLDFYTKVAKKPFVKDLMQTVPKVEKKVERKISTFMLVGKIIGFLNPLKKG